MADSPVVSSELGDLGAITRLTATGGTCIGWVWRAAVTCAGDLLGEAERRLLARLSVLRGGFDLEVAERVAGGEPLAPQAVAGLLASLAGKSLVQVQADPVAHYWLLETVRQFAAGRLAASGEDTAVHASLLEWALDEAWSAEPARPGAERAGWSGRLSAGQASIRAALSWALGGAEPEAGRAEVMLANAAFLAGDLAEQDRHGRARDRARPDRGRPGRAGPRAVRLVNVLDRRTEHPACHRGRARRGREPDSGVPGPLHRDGDAPSAGAAVRHLG